MIPVCYGHFPQPEYPIAFPSKADKARRAESIAWHSSCSAGDPWGYNRGFLESLGRCAPGVAR